MLTKVSRAKTAYWSAIRNQPAVEGQFGKMKLRPITAGVLRQRSAQYER